MKFYWFAFYSHYFQHKNKVRQISSDVLRDLVAFVQFIKREKQPWRHITFSKVAGFKRAILVRVTLLHGCFSRFLHCTNGTKSRDASQMIISYCLKRTHTLNVLS